MMKYCAFFLLLLQINSVLASNDFLVINGQDDLENVSKACYVSFGENFNLAQPDNKKTFDEFLQSDDLHNIKRLDLRNLDITDQHIETLSKNSSLVRVLDIDLSGNQRVSCDSVQHILDSDHLGSIRDLPQTSGSLGIPGCDIELRLKGTGAANQRQEVLEISRKGKRPFNIGYYSYQTGYEVSPPAKNGVKFVNCQF